MTPVLELISKKLLIDRSEILYNKPFTNEYLSKDWDIASGDWWTDNGWLTGRIRENSGGMIYSKNSYNGDIMLDFYGRTVPPCANDLNFTWHSEGWNNVKNDAGAGYIGSINGWWTGRAGIEKYPECRIQATTQVDFEPGVIYHIQAGTVQGQCFIFVNGRLMIEMTDADPLCPGNYGKVGFGTYCSFIQIRDFKLYSIACEDVSRSYTPEF